MSIIADIEEKALALDDSERALLAFHLLESLPVVLHDDDEGLAEAIRRDKEMDSDPSKMMSHSEFLRSFGR